MKTTTTLPSQTSTNSASQSSVSQSTPVTVGNDDNSGDSIRGPVQNDHWYTKTNGLDLLPFQYTLIIGGDSQQDHQPMQLSVDMDCQKPPLIVGGNGLMNLGNYGFSFYYCLTKLAVIGSITVHGITEEVIGYAWIDHQWGNFGNQHPPPYGLPLTYEWFSIKLNDNREIMVGDIWDRETGEKINLDFSNGLNLLNNNGSLELLEDYTITPLSFWNDSRDCRVFADKWHIIESSKLINLIITPTFLDQVMRFKENYPLLQQFIQERFPGGCLWEGVCTVSGTINNIPVNGKAYVELTHSYDYVDNTDSIPYNS